MSQHIMQLKLALRISASAKRITYWRNMFISQEYLFVNSFLSSESLAGIPAIAGLQIVQDLFDFPRTHRPAAHTAVTERQQEESDHGR